MPAPAAEMPARRTGEVIVDDRLATVLATVPGGHAGARTQYRQLLDLLGRTPPEFALPPAALDRLTALEKTVSAEERAQLVRALSPSLRHPGLILRLAAQSPLVAAAAIEAARLDDWQWAALATELPLAARGYLRNRAELGPRVRVVLGRMGIAELGLPAPAASALGDASPVSAPPSPDPGDGIGAIVRRIEAFRRSRKAGTLQFGGGAATSETDDLRLPLSDDEVETVAPAISAIRFASDARGHIVTADAPHAAMLVGFILGRPTGPGPVLTDPDTARAIRQRRPIHGGRLDLAGAVAIAGPWRIDAAPRFAAQGGRFLGYQGVLRRPLPDAASEAEGVADRLAQLLHELRTPVNAIQGFAELIQQQLFGPTPHQYRSLAASIAADSAAVLAGFEEIDRLVRFETGSGEVVGGHSDLAQVIERLLAQLEPGLARRDVRLTFDATGPAPVQVAASEAERMLWRVLALLGSAALPGETLALELAATRDSIGLVIALPQGLVEQDDTALFSVQPQPDAGAGSLGFLGGGFALRLARAEARSAGGSLLRDGSRLILRLPGLTPSAVAHSPAQTVPSVSSGGS
ncbi:MAG: histidine kinase dimerization/phospho-acceptor domain-containing protein [Novosphingobium sp.]|nr:histidine kinase dimerization/phospho-acceptor domain-containing protein [Novosphingobium sp.]